MKFWTKAFWKDATERVTATAAEALLGIMLATGFDLNHLSSWTGVWKSVAAVTLIAFLKTVLAGLKSPNTGAALFGTTVPADFVHAMETQVTVGTEGDKIGMGMPDEILAKPGDIIAGKGAPEETNSPVVVTAGPVPEYPPI